MNKLWRNGRSLLAEPSNHEPSNGKPAVPLGIIPSTT